MSRNSLLQAGTISKVSLGSRTRIQTHNHVVHKRALNHLAKLATLGTWFGYLFKNKVVVGSSLIAIT